jgi:DNA-binding XRE family transcriptional regulator
MDAFADYHSHDVYREDTFIEQFKLDLRSAKGLVICLSPFISSRRVETFEKEFRGCVRRGVRLCILTQAPKYADDPSVARTEAGGEMLQALGAHFTYRAAVHEKMAVIDETILWDASMNFLSHLDTSERVNRYCGRVHTEKAIREHNLYSCGQCKEISGFGFPSVEKFESEEQARIVGAIVARRIAFGWSQRQLAEACGVHRNEISALELGKTDARLSTLLRIANVLNLRMHSAPIYLMPRIHSVIEGSKAVDVQCLRSQASVRTVLQQATSKVR